MQFCAGLATVFLGTSTVEFDFSRLGQEATKEKSELANLPVAGAMHSRQ